MITSFTLARLVVTLFNFYSFLVLVYCLLTWFPIKPGSFIHDVGMVLDSIVGPFLRFFSRFIPPLGGIDFSPVIAIIALNLLEKLLLNLLL